MAEAGTLASRVLAHAAQGVFAHAWSFDPAVGLERARFERLPATARFARPHDLDALVALDEAAWAPPLRYGRDRLARRLAGLPEGCLVLQAGDRIRAAVHVRRVRSRATLLETPVLAAAEPDGQDDGPVFQLLGLVTDPAEPPGPGLVLLNVTLDWASCQPGVAAILGITRFGVYDRDRDGPIEAYAGMRGRDGLPIDPVPRFHAANGAHIEQLVPAARPEDTANLGFGLLIRYPLRGAADAPRPTELAPSANGDPAGGAPVARQVREAVSALMPAGSEAFDVDRTLGDLGLDSLALGELRSTLKARLGRGVDASFFFKHPTPAAMIAALEAGPPAPPAARPAAPEAAIHPQRVAPGGASPAWEPVAIVGHSLRAPGAADADRFFANLMDGRDCIARVPADRWDADEFTANEPGTLGRIGTDQGGFLDGIDLFDPAFFRLSRREAARLDPQHRLLLETAWEALERAGIDPQGLAGSRTAVFAAQFQRDYEMLQFRSADRQSLSLPYSTGSAPSTAVGRISYLLDLRGPCFSIEAACAGTLVALHAGCRALHAGDADCILAGGVNAILTPETSIAFSQAGMIAGDGRCRHLDAAADGYVRSEGAGMFVLKRLRDAEAARDRIEGIIIGGATGQDGASNGIVAPNGAAQEDLLQRALASAGIAAADVDMIEMHGTGTRLGDAVEAAAVARVHAGRGRPLVLGSVKTHVGHMESAAGVASVAKILGAFAAGAVPGNLHFATPSPEIDLAAIPAVVPTAPLPWTDAAAGRPVVGISGFGFNGSIAHLILQAPESLAPESLPPDAPAAAGPMVYPLSAPTEAALAALAQRHAAAVTAGISEAGRMADTAATGRGRFRHRLAVVAAGPEALAAGLRDAAAGAADRPPAETPAFELTRGAILRRGAAAADRDGGIAFLFTGQGSHEIGMARELYAAEPVARRAIDTVDAAVAAVLGRSLVEVLHGDDAEALDQLAQPAILAIEAALDALWRSWGVRPARILGHSLGEFAAAVSAGIVELGDAARIVAHRARLVAQAPGPGAMAVIEGDAAWVGVLIGPVADQVSVAALNGPSQTVVSGRVGGVAAVIEAAKAAGRRAHRTPITHAFHSPLMEPILDAFEAEVGRVPLARPAVPFLSSVTADWADAEVARPGYWRRHLRDTVRFREALARLAETGPSLAIELGPRPALVRQIAAEGLSIPAVSSLAGDGADVASLRAAAAAAYCHGAAVDWRAVLGPRRAPPAVLPTYPFQRTRCWFTDAPGRR